MPSGEVHGDGISGWQRFRRRALLGARWHHLPAASVGIDWRGPMVGFDLETTGVDPEAARVVSAALVWVDEAGAVLPASRGWLLDPAIDIPASATAVHGITTTVARNTGRPAGIGIAEIRAALDGVAEAGVPLVVFNAPYDLAVMAAEARRHRLLVRAAAGAGLVVLDPLVIDRGLDRYRKGPRTLAAMAAHYEQDAPRPHTADGDAIAACLVARALGRTFPQLTALGGDQLLEAQRDWHRGFGRRRRAYLAATGRWRGSLDRDWPVRPEHRRPAVIAAAGLSNRWWLARSSWAARRSRTAVSTSVSPTSTAGPAQNVGLQGMTASQPADRPGDHVAGDQRVRQPNGRETHPAAPAGQPDHRSVEDQPVRGGDASPEVEVLLTSPSD